MKRVAVFGNAGGGKSTLARRLAELTGLPLYVLDKIQFGEGGTVVPQDEYLKIHEALLAQDSWIIDGYGDDRTIWPRLDSADTLVFIDLPLRLHYWRVTKRLINGLVADPEGWPRNSPIWSSSLSSYRVIPRCHRYLTPKYRQVVADSAAVKRVAHLRSPRETAAFLGAVKNEFRTS